MKAVVAAFNQEKALVGAFSVITDLRMELFQALIIKLSPLRLHVGLHSSPVNAGTRPSEVDNDTYTDWTESNLYLLSLNSLLQWIQCVAVELVRVLVVIVVDVLVPRVDGEQRLHSVLGLDVVAVVVQLEPAGHTFLFLYFI